MPRVIIYRKKDTHKSISVPVGTRQDPRILQLYANTYRRAADIDAYDAPEMKKTLQALADLNTIGYQFDNRDIDPLSVRKEHGLDLANGNTASTTTAYRNNIESGVFKAGDSRWEYSGSVDLDPLSVGLDKKGAAMAGKTLADGQAYKARFFLVRLYTNASDSESTMIIPVFGDAAVTATLGAVNTDTGLPTDSDVLAAFRAKQESDAGTFVYIDWQEIGRCLYSRATTTITQTYFDPSDAKQKDAGIQFVDFRITHEDLTAAATSQVFTKRAFGKSLFFLGAALNVQTAFAGLTAGVVKLGTSGASEDDDFFADTPINVAGHIAPATPGVPQVKVSKDLLLTFSAGNNMDQATAGDLHVRVWYVAMPETPPAKGGVLSFQ